MCSPPLREAGKPSLPLILLTLLFSYPPLREVGIAYLSERTLLTKVLGSTFLWKPTPQKLRGNFSKKPPESILVWGQDGMDGGSEEGTWEGAGDGWGRAIPHSYAAIHHPAYTSHWENPNSPGEGSGKRTGQGQGKGNAKPPGARKAENLKPYSERASPTVEEVSGRQGRQNPESRQARSSSCNTRSQRPSQRDLQPQLDQLRNDLRDPRQPGAPGLKAARRRPPPPPPPAHPQGAAGLTLSSDDMVGRPDRHVAKVRPSCCGSARHRRRERRRNDPRSGLMRILRRFPRR